MKLNKPKIPIPYLLAGRLVNMTWGVWMVSVLLLGFIIWGVWFII